MRTIYFLFVFVTLLSSCKKEAHMEVSGTVIGEGGPVAGSFIVKIDNADINDYSFICKNQSTMPPYPEVSCYTHIYITNLPSTLKVANLKIRFSKFKDKGKNSVFSSIIPPHDLEVYNATKAQ